MISREVEAVKRKQKIRERYKGVDASELDVIPAKTVEGLEESTSIQCVTAYVRVSTNNDEQTSSYELQKNYYTEHIKTQPDWEFVGIYDDAPVIIGIKQNQTQAGVALVLFFLFISIYEIFMVLHQVNKQ